MCARLLPCCVVALLLPALSGDGKQPPSRNSKAFWIDPVTHNQFVALQGPEKGTQPGDTPSGKAPAAKKRELAELLRVIEAKEKELDGLRVKAAALRRQIAALEEKAGGKGKVFTSPQELVACLPANARPKHAEDTIRLERANDWLADHVVGKRLQWTYTLGAPKLQRVGRSKDYVISWSVLDKSNRYKLHGSVWLVRVQTPVMFRTPSGKEMIKESRLSSADIRVLVDEATAEQLQRISEKPVKLTATIRRARFGNFPPANNTLLILASNFTIDGIKTASPPPVVVRVGRQGHGGEEGRSQPSAVTPRGPLWRAGAASEPTPLGVWSPGGYVRWGPPCVCSSSPVSSRALSGGRLPWTLGRF
jgi:hypothetical protein